MPKVILSTGKVLEFPYTTAGMIAARKTAVKYKGRLVVAPNAAAKKKGYKRSK